MTSMRDIMLPKQDVDEADPRIDLNPQASSEKVLSKTETTLPSYKQLLMFTMTTAMVWLAEPILSLVDTTVVSMTSSAESAIVQIAALGPATILYDSEMYTTYCLASTTTNQLAPLLAKKKWKELRERTSVLMGLSVLLGSLIMAVNFAFGKSLLELMAGSLTEPGIVPLATKYVLIRTTVAPCAIVLIVAQAFCLTNLDTKTPTIAVLVASIANIIGDLALSPTWGIQGAAVATALSTLLACLILANKVRKTTLEWKQKQEEEDSQQGLMTTSGVSEDIPFWSLPDKESLLVLLRLAGPISFFLMSQIACYSMMTLRATNFGIVNLATHNIMMRIFFFFACFGDSVGQAAESFFPQVAKDERGKLIQRLLGLSVVAGLFNFMSSNFILTRLGAFLTKEAAISKMMGQYAPYVGISAVAYPIAAFLEGLLLAKRDLKFLAGSYLTTLIILGGFVFSPLCATLQGLWRALFFFQGSLLIQFATRTWTKSTKEKTSQTS
jgi:Na+-driven multidrug efflux pump